MIKSITIKNYVGDSIKLEMTRPEKSGFAIIGCEGLGPAKATVNTTTLAMSDGGLFNSAYLEQRNIVLSLRFIETKTETIEDIRQKSYKYFPMKKKLRFTVETDNRRLETEGYVESNEPSIFSDAEGCTISILCPDPYFYSPKTSDTVFSGLAPMFEFPFENDSTTEPLLELSIIENRREAVVYNEGDAEIGITVSIYAVGEASDVTIHNLSTKEKMHINTVRLAEMTGNGIITGDQITIETRPGMKSITLLRGGEVINILNCLDKGTTWFRLSKGDNIFAYTAETGSSNLQFCISNKIVYEGV